MSIFFASFPNFLMHFPNLQIERRLRKEGYRRIVGLDEVGCGSLAGPVMAGAVVLPLSIRLPGLRDSKLLSVSQREKMSDLIIERSEAWAIGEASVEEISEIGIRRATFLAMRRAFEQISGVDFLLVDAWHIPDVSLPQCGIIRGDQSVCSIAAASVVAKVVRDDRLRALAKIYPKYGFEIHKGYATEAHRKAIEAHGPCAIHRKTWKPFKQRQTAVMSENFNVSH